MSRGIRWYIGICMGYIKYVIFFGQEAVNRGLSLQSSVEIFGLLMIQQYLYNI